MHLTDAVCTEDFRRCALDAYPALAQNRAYARLFGWIAFGSARCKRTGELLCPSEILAQAERKDHLLNQRNYTGYHLLQGFAEEVMPLSISPWTGFGGLCRTVAAPDLKPSVQEAIDEERATAYSAAPRVYLEDGRPVTPKRQKSIREQCRARALERMSMAQCHDASRWLKYLNALKPNRFTSILDNLESATRVAEALPKPESRNHALSLLMAIRDQPLPFYQPSGRGRTVRIFGYTESLLSLKKSVRRALTPEWIEMDLRSSQASIIARDWGVESLQAFLTGGGNLWELIMDGLGIAQTPDAKSAIKEAFYATVFGMEERSIAWMLSHEFERHGFGRRFLNIPLMQDILTCRERRMDQVIRAGGAETCYGNKIALTDECDAKSVLAQCTQASEMMLLTPVLNLAEQHTSKSGITVTLFQHDGFSFQSHKSEDAEHWVSRLQAAVAERAEALGYATRLECQ